MSARVWLIFIIAALAPGQTTAPAILEAKCLACHGAAKMSDLDMRTRAAMLKGGTRGAALVPGKAGESLLYQAVRREGKLQMPPGSQPLTAEEIAIIGKWIDGGANMDSAAHQESNWWSFRPPKKPPIPNDETGWASNDLDRLLAAGLRKQGLRPAPPADKLTLLRRATFDLHGLPPAPEQIDAFGKDNAPGAWERLIDSLLASPAYGERWGRHWLDVVRYADTGGYETDVYFANAWRYRDYAIGSFNQDKPYNIFVQEQIAADEIWPDDLELEGSYELPERKRINLAKRIGTGLYTIGPMAAEYTFFGDQYRAEWQADAVETTGSAFLGLSFNCARCHDHKFDPIPQRDYYRLAAFFATSEDREVPIVSRMGIYEYTRYQTRLRIAEDLKAELARLEGEVRKRAASDRKNPQREDGPLPFTPEEKDRRETLLRKIGEAFYKAPKPYATANLLVPSERVHDTHVLVRGEWAQKSEKVTPGYPAVLNAGGAVEETQRRKALAQWITSADQPLLARVMVNRIWQGHFGQGLVATPNDFGRQGELPVHPELLDWLAVRFREEGYSIKQMHRLIMQSAAYRMSSMAVEANQKIDPRNQYFWRMNRRRLEAEAVRDAVLAASGTLNREAGGPAVVVPLSQEERLGMRDASQWPVSPDPAEHARRSVYLLVKRSFRLPMLEAFDAPDPAQSCARREEWTVAPQALALMNSAFTSTQADAMAASLRGLSPGEQVLQAFLRTLGRRPTEEERAKALAFVERNKLERFCLLLFNLSEFVYVD
ncbi:MAG: DUF1553 domain-containing protein [Acidimicrobiia bacterium]|nr:DUF1553 domain-containing protein [Acidimicrobiia bacterium]